MEVDLFEPQPFNGKLERVITVREELSSGHWQQVQANVWVMADLSTAEAKEAGRAETIALLERALAALRQT